MKARTFFYYLIRFWTCLRLIEKEGWAIKRILFTLLLLIQFVSALGCARDRTISGERVLVLVNGEAITERSLGVRTGLYTLVYGISPAGTDLSGMLLEELIEEALLFQKAKALSTIPSMRDVENEKDQFMEYLVKQYGSEAEVVQQMKANHVSDQDLLEFVFKMMSIDRLFDYVTEDVVVTDEEILAYYQENREMFFEPKRVRARHILVSSKVLAEELLTALKTGADFSDLARRYSMDLSTKDQGGDLGYVPQSGIIPELEKAMFNLGIGQLSGVIETEMGFHIVKVEDRLAERYVPLDEVREYVTQTLTAQRKAEKFRQFYQEALESAVIERR